MVSAFLIMELPNGRKKRTAFRRSVQEMVRPSSNNLTGLCRNKTKVSFPTKRRLNQLGFELADKWNLNRSVMSENSEQASPRRAYCFYGLHLSRYAPPAHTCHDHG
ncbi:MAG: hypothetical protein OJF52_002926 [Nitrospira sp.]|jgi:hypothetical protein|nr:MAG: hypothetical protein OJF52_002926 [Nitrospira sp.]